MSSRRLGGGRSDWRIREEEILAWIEKEVEWARVESKRREDGRNEPLGRPSTFSSPACNSGSPSTSMILAASAAASASAFPVASCLGLTTSSASEREGERREVSTRSSRRNETSALARRKPLTLHPFDETVECSSESCSQSGADPVDPVRSVELSQHDVWGERSRWVQRAASVEDADHLSDEERESDSDGCEEGSSVLSTNKEEISLLVASRMERDWRLPFRRREAG